MTINKCKYIFIYLHIYAIITYIRISFFLFFLPLSLFNLLCLSMVPFVLHHCLTQSHDFFKDMNADLLIK